MQRSAQPRPTTGRRNRRVIALGAAVVVFGGMIAVTQVSDAASRRFWGRQPAATASPCVDSSRAPIRRYNTETDLSTSTGGQVENHVGDGQSADGNAIERRARQRARTPRCTPSAGTSTPSAGTSEGTDPTTDPTTDPNAPPNDAGGADGNNNGLQVLGRQCEGRSEREIHTGFQNGNQCVNTEMGEVGTAANNPSLLIVDAPTEVGVGEPFTLSVSTRNLVRDRFLGAAAGGYYLESSFLNEDGLVRGHFHTACQVLDSTEEAPNPEPVPAFFVATEDGAGGAEPDTVQINVPGINQAGTIRCSSWAGDGSHRIPMMQRANQTPAFDTVRIEVG